MDKSSCETGAGQTNLARPDMIYDRICFEYQEAGGLMKNGKEKSMFVREYLWRDLMTVCGLVRNSSDDRDRRIPCIQGIMPHSWSTDIPSWNS